MYRSVSSAPKSKKHETCETLHIPDAGSVIHVAASEDDPGYKTTPEKTVKVAGPYLFFDSECYKEVRAREKGQRRTRM